MPIYHDYGLTVFPSLAEAERYSFRYYDKHYDRANTQDGYLVRRLNTLTKYFEWAIVLLPTQGFI